MSDHKRSVRVGAAAILLAVMFRLGASALPGKILSWLRESNIAAFVIYLETGQDVRFSASREVFSPEYPGESAAPMLPAPQEPPEPERPDYASDPLPRLTNSAALELDMPWLLASPLRWELSAQWPTVLIYSTHTTESYTKAGESYAESAAWRTLDEGYNMVSIGDLVAQLLEEAGIRVRCLSDYYHGPVPQADAHCLVVDYSGLDDADLDTLEEVLETL